MKKGTISIMILVVLLVLLVISAFVAYTMIYVPGDYVMRIENTVSPTANIVYIYENGKVIINNAGINKYKMSMSKDDVKELLELLPDCEVTTKVYVVTTADGKETNVVNRFQDTVAEKLNIKDIFTEGVK